MLRGRPPILILACVAALASCRQQTAEPVTERREEVVPVGAIRAEVAGIRAMVQASGLVVPAEGAEFLVRPPEPARVVDIAKAQGETVSSGEVVARFELSSAAQDLTRLNADLAGAQAQFENARISQTRMREFVEKGMVPRRDLEQADRDLTEAQAAVTRARTAQARAEAAAARAVVRAPFGGIVAARQHQPGDFISSTNEYVLRIVDPARLEVVAQVPDTDIARVVPGASARLAGAVDGNVVRLHVAGRLPPDRAIGQAQPVRLLFVDPVTIPVDTSVEIDIDAEEGTDIVLLPAEAIVRDGGETVVFIAAGDRAERRVVTTGLADDARVEIRSGVKPGELVINRGQVGLTDGALISADVTPDSSSRAR
jgi:RND family efflux transporter MFP subunit